MTDYANASIKRGCGKRKEGGVYAESGNSKKGSPLESFVLCPPIPFDPDEFGISPIGVQLRQFQGETWHIVDWVGSKYYPNVTDFLEEVRRFGLSRRLPRSLDFSKLTNESRLYLVHSQAWIEKPSPYLSNRLGGNRVGMVWDSCPRGIEHADGEICSGLWWEDVVGMKTSATRVGNRVMPAFQYSAAKPPNSSDGEHGVAFFAKFPIHRLALIRAEDGSHNDTAKLVSKSEIRLDILDE